MQNNIFLTVHLLLMEEVDGPAAERFCQHVAESIGDLETINTRYDQSTQIRWMTGYWLMQLSRLNISPLERFNINNLLICSSINEFITVFKSTVLPVIMANGDIPDLTIPVYSLEAHRHGARP